MLSRIPRWGVELLEGLEKAQISFLDQIQDRHAGPAVFHGDDDDHPQAGQNQPGPGLPVLVLAVEDGQAVLFFARQVGCAADLRQVVDQRIVGRNFPSGPLPPRPGPVRRSVREEDLPPR